MIRPLLPAAVLLIFGTFAWAEDLHVPGLSPNPGPPKLELPACDLHVGSQKNCARILACIGGDGLWFDGQARGWNGGDVLGQRSDGVVCVGTYTYGGLFGSASARIECQDGTVGQVIYYAQDEETSTGIARGMDSRGRMIKAWTGANVLEFLGKTDDKPALLPCRNEAIPIS